MFFDGWSGLVRVLLLSSSVALAEGVTAIGLLVGLELPPESTFPDAFR